MPSFGDQLRRLRELAGLTQEELGARSGLTAKAISLIERGGRRSPYPHTVRALADALGVDAAERADLIAALPRRGQRVAADTQESRAGGAAVATSPTPAEPVRENGVSDPAAARWALRNWFPQTKLRPPVGAVTLLPRPHLLDQARAAILAHRLTLVAAPAGSGKTTLLAALPGAMPDLPVAWLALDADDNDPATFASALALALRAALPALGGATEALIDSLPDPGTQLRRLMGTLVNDLAAAPVGPFVLVLDDLHAIDAPEIYAALDHLLERLPDDAHVAAAARYDPPLSLARLRARGQLAEFRLPELRFTARETGQLLNDRLTLELPPGEVQVLHERVGGWAAGLRLLALMLGRLPTPAERREFVSRLGEDGRYIFDFLAEEVLGQQEPELQRFLLDAAILPELTAALCRAVTGRDDAAQMLDRAYRRNLFLMRGGGPVAEAGTTFRFHALFADFLRGRLEGESPARVRELHRRAGDATSDPARAIAHYSAAECWDDAARVIEQHGPDFARHGMYRRLHDWIAALPVEVRDSRPALSLILGAYAFYTGEWERSRPLLERARRGLLAAGDDEGASEALILLISIASRTGDSETVARLQGQAGEEALLPARFRIFLLMGRAWDEIRSGELADVDTHIATCVDLLLASDDLADWNLAVLAPPLALGRVGPALLERYGRAALRKFGTGPSLAAANAEQLLGYLHLVRGELDAAGAMIATAIAHSEQLGGFAEIDPGVTSTIVNLALIRGDVAGAERHLRGRLPQIEQNALLRGWIYGYWFLLGKIHWRQGRHAELRALAGRLATAEQLHDFPLTSQARLLLEGMLATAEGRYADAERDLRAASALHPPYYTVLFWLEHPQLLLAQCYASWGRPREALAALIPVLAECERLGTPGIILKVGPALAPALRLAAERDQHAAFATTILNQLEAPGARVEAEGGLAVPDTGETLSPREIEVLRLIAQGASNATIAATLFISTNTVKTHVARLLAKLGVASRNQAAARARDLGCA